MKKVVLFLLSLLFFIHCNKEQIKNINLNYSIPLETSPAAVNSKDIVDVKDAFKFLTSKANKYIYIAGLYFTANMNKDIIKELEKAVKRGVKLRFLFSDTEFSRREFFNLKLSKLKNVEVAFIDVAELGQSKWGQMHNKYAVFDDKYAIIGSANFSYPAFNDNIEINMLVTETNIVKDMKRIFLYDWQYAKTGKLQKKSFFASVNTIDLSKPIILLESTPFELDTPDIPNIVDGITVLLNSAKKNIDLEIYAITSTYSNFPLYITLLKKALERGVKIRILTSQSTYDALNDDGEYKYPHIRAAINALKDVGITEIKKFNIWEAAKTHYSAVHSKLLLVDSKYVMLGSNNWTKSASQENIEMAIITSMTQIVRPLQRKFNKDWNSPFAEHI